MHAHIAISASIPSFSSLVLANGHAAPQRMLRFVGHPRGWALLLAAWCVLGGSPPVMAQTWQQRLATEEPAALAREARHSGDARRGAIVFHQPHLACTQCHVTGRSEQTLGPDLSKTGEAATNGEPSNRERTDAYLVESVLQPSKVIKQGYQTVTVLTTDGKSIAGLVASDQPDRLVIRDAAQNFRTITIRRDDIEQSQPGRLSIMPEGQVNALASRQQFLDLIRYLIEIRDGGAARAAELQPPPSSYAARPLPDYESRIDHAGMIAGLNADSFRRGEAIYNRLCINCHGTHEQPGSLPTSLRFASGAFKNGRDPFTMYQTLTRGFGMMVPQTWMVPQQKYDVIHYIREAYLKTHNPAQYFAADPTYLASLPPGDTRGPEPSNILPWEQMDYGPNLVATYEIGTDGSNFAYKGNAIRLDAGPGGVSQGRHWMVFDYDTLRVAAGWSGKGFIDWNGINFNGRHGVHPRVTGHVQFANPTGPGWANPETGQFEDPRLRGRDDRAYGPLPRSWAHYKGMYYHGSDTLIAYTVGRSSILELPGLQMIADADQSAPVFKRTFQIGPRDRDLLLQVAQRDGARIRVVEGKATKEESKDQHGSTRYVVWGESQQPQAAGPDQPVQFQGSTRLELRQPDDFKMHDRDYTISARIKTRKGGTIFAQTADQPLWVPDGKTLFVRGGRLAFDIGWVGAVTSRRRVDDGDWHDVAIVYTAKEEQVRLYIDGQLDAQGRLKAKQPVTGFLARIGYTASNFPGEQSFFEGQLSQVRFYQRTLSEQELRQAKADEQKADPQLLGHWDPASARGDRVVDLTGRGHDGHVVTGSAGPSERAAGHLVAGIAGMTEGLAWQDDSQGNLRLRIPAGDRPLRFMLWLSNVDNDQHVSDLVSSLDLNDAQRDLQAMTQGGPPRWPDVLTTKAAIGSDDGPFAVDVLTWPESNPWFCLMRLTGFDFFPDGERAAVCSWDGNVWLVSGLASLPAQATGESTSAATGELRWRRIASGLFQPLGVKIVNGQIYVTCRDQICLLHDRNGDGETDYYQNFNNDHQVTDHFHEFAMGLQTDEQGNFYYAKSARHALPALVPHHGTLLRVSPDGTRTDIVASGFRAANGVCLNPDGTFIVTDQEGHWNPKNRINWVRPGGFYGNMFGYHDVTDSSDSAMQQPLCWITNAFDRSPAELLWVDSPRWGPLQGSLLNLSYGYGKVYVVPHEEIEGQKQGGMCELPIPQFPTGVMRGRFHPADGQLYLCGMFAWGGAQQQPGGFYRLRYTGQPVHLPIGLQAKRSGMRIQFSGPLDADSAGNADNYRVKVWSLKRSANYGSPHIDEHPVKVAAATLADDGRSVTLDIPGIGPTWGMEIDYTLKSADGQPIRGTIHNTIHKLKDK